MKSTLAVKEKVPIRHFQLTCENSYRIQINIIQVNSLLLISGDVNKSCDIFFLENFSFIEKYTTLARYWDRVKKDTR